MVQRRFNPQAAFLGPFLGLNTTTDASELPPQYASVCRNIILSDGRIRPRAPWDVLAGLPLILRDVRGMYFWQKRDSPLDAFVVAKIGTLLYRINVQRPGPEGPPQISILSGLGSDDFASFVRRGDFLYVFDGSDRSVKTDGTVEGTLLLGIDVPTPTIVSSLSVRSGASPGIDAEVEYKIAWYDRARNVESNPRTLLAATLILSSTQEVAIIYDASGGRFPSQQGITHMRIYRRNETLGQVGFRLLAEVAVPSNGEYVDNARGDTQANEDVDVPLSSRTTGPFAPILNKIPRHVKLGAIHNGRLFFGKKSVPGGDEVDGRVYYSLKGFPDYEDETFLDVQGDTDEVIRGLAVVGDQLIIGKRRSIWINSGEVITATNLDRALGNQPLDPSHRVYRTHADIGPTGQQGNNMVIAGEPAQVYFASDAGAVSFDGVNTQILSDAIEAEWRLFVGNPPDRIQLGFSFADDSQKGVLYMAVSTLDEPGPIQCLAYHYRLNRGDGIGAWSVIDDGDQKIDGRSFTVTAVAPAVPPSGDNLRGQVLGTAPLIGTTISTVLMANGDDPDAYVPTFEWLSGSMPLARGMKAHVYWVKFFLNRSQAVNGQAPVMRLSVLTDQLERASASPRVDTIDVDTSQRDTVLLSIRRHAKTVRIRIERGPGWTKGWDPHLGVLGWQPDTELVGQR